MCKYCRCFKCSDTRNIKCHAAYQLYRVAHEKPAHRLVDQRGRRSWTLYRKLNKCKRKVLTD